MTVLRSQVAGFDPRSPSCHIQIVGWNHREHLGACLRSCLAQEPSAPVLYVDNASSDGSAEFVRAAFPSVLVHVNAVNRGYAGGHNDGLRIMRATAVAVLLNPDVVLFPGFLFACLRSLTDERVGAVAPLLLRAGHDTIDAYGIILRRSLRGVNQYEGRRYHSNNALPSGTSAVWGFTGAAVALRRRALADVAASGQVFDEALHAYREDVDLSWRLKHRGWDIVGSPEARATHVRSVTRAKRKPPRIAQLSWRNYFLVLVKDVPLPVLLTHAIPVLGEGLLRVVLLLARPSLWPALPECLRLLPVFLRKRRNALPGRSS